MFNLKYFKFVIIALVALSNFAPASVSAQSGRVPQQPRTTVVAVCFNSAQGGIYRLVDSTKSCVSGFTKQGIDTSTDPDICIVQSGTTWGLDPDPNMTRDSCVAKSGKYWNVTSITTVVPSTGGGTTPGTTPGTNPGTTPGTKPPIPQSQGSCDPEFFQEGALCVPKKETCDGLVCSQTVGDLVASVLRILLILAGIVAVVFSVIGGYQIMTASSNDTQATEGKKTLRNALIGLAIVLASYALITVLINLLTNNVT